MVQRALLGLIFCFSVSVLVAGCGGATKSASVANSSGAAKLDEAVASSGREEVVAKVAQVPVTRTAVNHWMVALASEDYFAISGKTNVPDAIVSDPPSYPRCVRELERASTKVPVTSEKPSGAQLFGKCQQLYRALRTQATSFLVQAEWTIASDRDLGITATDSEVLSAFNKVKMSAYPSLGALSAYMVARHLSTADMLLETHLNLLAQKMLARISSEGKQTAFARLRPVWAKWDQETSCSKGYVVEHCKQYKGGFTYGHSPSASVLMEQVGSIITGRCIDAVACGKKS